MDGSQDHPTLNRGRPYTIQAGEDAGQNEQQAIEDEIGQVDGDMLLSDDEGGLTSAREQNSIKDGEQDGRERGGGQTHCTRINGEGLEITEEKQEHELWLQENTMAHVGVYIDGRPVLPSPEATASS